jgi:hypothetical protein
MLVPAALGLALAAVAPVADAALPVGGELVIDLA